MELWDAYNQNRELTGEVLVRGEPIPDGRYHLVVQVWIRNSRGQYLISQRAADRPSYSWKWECIGGSVTKGEDSLTGALREVREEVGIDLAPEAGKLVYSVIGRVHEGVHFHDILDVWLFAYDGEVSLEQATTKEVVQTRWMNLDQIRELYESRELVDTLGYFFTEVAGKDV